MGGLAQSRAAGGEIMKTFTVYLKDKPPVSIPADRYAPEGRAYVFYDTENKVVLIVPQWEVAEVRVG